MLWKAAKPEDEAVGAAWDAPFGRGRPGWHIECSAMALELLGQRWGVDVLDIHAGGVDLIFPHHEDEIAQSCAYTGRDEFARFWLHGEFLNIRGEKMSKRFGNITTARDLREDGVDPGAIRLFMYQTHYRQKLDLTDEGLAAAQEASRRLGEFQNRLMESDAQEDSPAMAHAAEQLGGALTEALDDDLNAPRAVAAMFNFMNQAHAALDAGDRAGPASRSAWDRAESILRVTSKVVVMKVKSAGADAVLVARSTKIHRPIRTPRKAGPRPGQPNGLASSLSAITRRPIGFARCSPCTASRCGMPGTDLSRWYAERFQSEQVNSSPINPTAGLHRPTQPSQPSGCLPGQCHG